MLRSKGVVKKFASDKAYTVVSGGQPSLAHDDIHECLKALREHPKGELYRNADRELLAYTTGTGPGRGGRDNK